MNVCGDNPAAEVQSGLNRRPVRTTARVRGVSYLVPVGGLSYTIVNFIFETHPARLHLCWRGRSPTDHDVKVQPRTTDVQQRIVQTDRGVRVHWGVTQRSKGHTVSSAKSLRGRVRSSLYTTATTQIYTCGVRRSPGGHRVTMRSQWCYNWQCAGMFVCMCCVCVQVVHSGVQLGLLPCYLHALLQLWLHPPGVTSSAPLGDVIIGRQYLARSGATTAQTSRCSLRCLCTRCLDRAALPDLVKFNWFELCSKSLVSCLV